VSDLELSRRWMRAGAACGFAGGMAYALAAFAPLPEMLSYAAAFAFGPLLALGIVGLYHGLATGGGPGPGPLLQSAAILGIAGGFTVLIMLTTQQSIFELMDRAIDKAASPAEGEAYRQVLQGLNAVQLGLDVAWDVMIGASVVLFGIAMQGHPAYGRVVGGVGVVLGILLLGFNLYHFPVPPRDSSSIDWGPFVALWMMVVFVMLLRQGRKTAGRLDG
jgi:hypothetical protein